MPLQTESYLFSELSGDSSVIFSGHLTACNLGITAVILHVISQFPDNYPRFLESQLDTWLLCHPPAASTVPGPSWCVVSSVKGQMLHPNIDSASPCSGDHQRHEWMETWSSPSTADHLVGMTMCMKLTPGGGGGVMPPPHLPGLLGTFWACMGLEAQTPWFAQHTVCAMWMPSTHMSCCPITLLLTNNGKEFKDDPTRACQVLPKHGV